MREPYPSLLLNLEDIDQILFICNGWLGHFIISFHPYGDTTKIDWVIWWGSWLLPNTSPFTLITMVHQPDHYRVHLSSSVGLNLHSIFILILYRLSLLYLCNLSICCTNLHNPIPSCPWRTLLYLFSRPLFPTKQPSQNPSLAFQLIWLRLPFCRLLLAG